HRLVEHNLKLGELVVTGIPPGPAGQGVTIRFTYDLNGILEVEGYVPGSGKKCRTVLTQHVKELGEKKLREAIQKLQSLKYYPREDLKNQRLLRFCERVVGEISPYHRDQLEAAIDSFEAAMAAGEKELVQYSQQ